MVYYWPQMHEDYKEKVTLCAQSQFHGPLVHAPNKLNPIMSLWLFMRWEMNIVNSIRTDEKSSK